MSPTGRRLRARQAVAGMLVALVALGVVRLAAPSQAPPSAPSVLTAAVFPRQDAFKRSFNPFRADSLWPTRAGIYEPLLICNRATGVVTPWLATAYKWSSDNLTLRVTTRPGVRWSDGQPFSARDVAFTFNLMRRFPALDQAQVWRFLADVSAPDAQTVEFKLKRPYTPGEIYLGEQAIVAEHKWKDVTQPATFDDPSPVATGPFVTVRRFEPMVYELARNPTYWQPGKPAVEVLRVPRFRGNDEIARALAANEVDWASLFFPDIATEWVATNPTQHQYWYADTGGTALVYLDTGQKPLDDPSVRKALSMALDRPRITKEAMKGHAPPADATGLADSQKRWKDPTLAQDPWTRRNVGEANKLLDAAGLPRGADGIRAAGTTPMRYTFQVVQGWTDWMAVAEIVRENLAEVGVAVTVKTLEYAVWDDTLRRGRFDMSLGFGSRGPTPYEFYRSQMDGTLVRPAGERAEQNFHRFADPEAEKILRRFEETSDAAESSRLAVELQRRFAINAPSIPLFISPQWGVYNTTRLTGFPSRFRPYASAIPGGSPTGGYPAPDALPVLLEVKPR